MEDKEYLRDQIRNSLNLKDTEELVEMWRTHDTEEWTDLAFEVVKDILQERLGEVPPQYEVVQKPVGTIQDDAESEEALLTAASLRGAEKILVCPYCQNNNVFVRSVEIRDRAAEVVLKKPAIDLPRFLGVDTEYDEIVGFACEDCGYVFFMLKDFV